MMFVGFQGILLADHHENSQASKDTEEIINTVHKMYEMVNSKKNWSPVVSPKGTHMFFSSGGFLNFVTPEMMKNFPAIESNTIRPKHITVVPVEPGKVAVAMFYAEGSVKIAGQPAVDHYMTRATVVFAKEKDSWKIRAMHWSPISGGQGTSSISVKK